MLELAAMDRSDTGLLSGKVNDFVAGVRMV